MSLPSGFTHPKRRSLTTIPTSNLTRSLPFPCRCSNTKRYNAEVRVMAEMTMLPIALMRGYRGISDPCRTRRGVGCRQETSPDGTSKTFAMEWAME